MGMIRHLGLQDEICQSWTSGYELATREPSLSLSRKSRRLGAIYMASVLRDGLPLGWLSIRMDQGDHLRIRGIIS